jgi:hypothetical protein
MMDEVSSKKTRCEEFLDEKQRDLSEPLHRRLIKAYRSDYHYDESQEIFFSSSFISLIFFI